ncbi:hypothetical protein [Streptomyces sp. ITFR-16]|uniref:hypothetical protein n=1 Tax=Streptomyces sp. ITFR-16 TaxID=3075198 RepID=UPI002889F528|nr:hypothetical protein [Streptomyces sp. ITFR-16]WNI23332.1 hypothetical protein RLT58_15960 [Streptomyces sp. ITFR-16]
MSPSVGRAARRAVAQRKRWSAAVAQAFASARQANGLTLPSASSLARVSAGSAAAGPPPEPQPAAAPGHGE